MSLTQAEKRALMSEVERINGDILFHPAPLIAAKMIERHTPRDYSGHHPKNRIRWSVVAAWVGAIALAVAVWAAVVKVIL